MTRKDWLWAEQRAAELGIDAPRGMPSVGYTPDEYKGWSINFWDYKTPGMSDKAWRKALWTVPHGREQWAGWLAREVFHAIWAP